MVLLGKARSDAIQAQSAAATPAAAPAPAPSFSSAGAFIGDPTVDPGAPTSRVAAPVSGFTPGPEPTRDGLTDADRAAGFIAPGVTTGRTQEDAATRQKSTGAAVPERIPTPQEQQIPNFEGCLLAGQFRLLPPSRLLLYY